MSATPRSVSAEQSQTRASHAPRKRTLAAALSLFGGTAILLSQTAAAQAPAAGHYKGKTSEKSAVTFSVSAGGKQIRDFKAEISYNGKCGPGGGPGFQVAVAAIAIGKAGAFHASTLGRFFDAASKVQPLKIAISGKVAGGHAHGNISEIAGRCSKESHSSANPYSESFTATVG